MNTSIVKAIGVMAMSSLGGSVAARVWLLGAERVIRFFFFFLLTEVIEQWDTTRVLNY